MSERMTPHADQEKAIAHILSNQTTLLRAPVGAGKTICSVEAYLRSGATQALTVGPLNTRKGWSETLRKQTEGTQELRFLDNRKAGVLAFGDLMRGVPGYYFIGRERFRTLGWEQLSLDVFMTLDECHVGANRKGVTHSMLKTVPKEVRKLWMSATPEGNRIEGLWANLRVLFPKETARSYWSWLTEWVATERGEYTYLTTSGEKNPGALWKSLPSAHTMPSVYNKKPVIHDVEVELSPKQRKHYKELEQEAVTFLGENPLAPELPSVMYMRLLQLTLAVPSIKQGWKRVYNPDIDEWEEEWGDILFFEDDAKSSKADAVLDILSDLHAGEEKPAVTVFTHSRIFADLLVKRLEAKKYRVRGFTGGLKDEQRQELLSEFGVSYDVMVATIPSIAEGTDGMQKVCHNEIWVSHSDNRILNQQCAGRNNRQGQTKTVNRWVISALDTVETKKQLGRLKFDQSLIDASFEEKEMVSA